MWLIEVRRDRRLRPRVGSELNFSRRLGQLTQLILAGLNSLAAANASLNSRHASASMFAVDSKRARSLLCLGSTSCTPARSGPGTSGVICGAICELPSTKGVPIAAV